MGLKHSNFTLGLFYFSFGKSVFEDFFSHLELDKEIGIVGGSPANHGCKSEHLHRLGTAMHPWELWGAAHGLAKQEERGNHTPTKA